MAAQNQIMAHNCFHKRGKREWGEGKEGNSALPATLDNPKVSLKEIRPKLSRTEDAGYRILKCKEGPEDKYRNKENLLKILSMKTSPSLLAKSN